MDKSLVERFQALYKGLNRARGIWKKNGFVETVKEAPEYQHFEDHLNGKVGVGVVPIDETNMCLWGAIDIDAHADGEFVDLQEVNRRVDEKGYPLVICQSKSQGAHLYLFLAEKVPASIVQDTLKRWTADLGYPGVEVFPKQRSLKEGTIGNWINLPYFNASDTVRYAYAGKPLSLEEFLDLAESRLTTKVKLSEYGFDKTHMDAPPCIRHMLTHGDVKSGVRNQALFNVAVYLKKVGVDDLEEELLKVNYDKNIFSKGIPKREVGTIAGSVSRNDYMYRCNEEPICSLCDKELCKNSKYGIGGNGPSAIYHDFMFSGIRKLMTDPPRYIVNVNDGEMVIDHNTLLNFINFKGACFMHLDLVIPPMKQMDWEAVLKSKVDVMEKIDAPDDVGPKAMIEGMLDEFTSVCERMDAQGKPILGKREDVMRGIPSLVADFGDNKYYVIFKSTDFVSFLKRRRAEEMKGADLWVALRNMGCDHRKVRMGNKVIRVWTKPANLDKIQFDPVDIQEKF